MKNDSSKGKVRNANDATPSDVPANAAVYQEYVRGFDDIPVLQDAVHVPPRPPVQPDFRRGERRDARREQRPDAYSIREANRADFERLYREYSEPVPTELPSKGKKRKRKTQKRKVQKRKTQKRKSSSRSALTEPGSRATPRAE